MEGGVANVVLAQKDGDATGAVMKYEEARDRMVRHQIEHRGVDDARVLEAMRTVPREEFVPRRYRSGAYRDGPLPIGRGQTISQPFVVALMTLALEIEPGDKVLEVGTGSGYQAAVLAAMGADVFTIERHDALAERARKALEETGYDVDVRCGDGSQGLWEQAPFDAILVTAAGPTVPTTLLEQLEEDGHLVIPVEERRGRQTLIRVTRKADGSFDRKELGEVAFVPLIGEEGWDEEPASWWG